MLQYSLHKKLTGEKWLHKYPYVNQHLGDWQKKAKNAGFQTGAYTEILDWSLEHKGSQALPSVMALDFIFLSILTSKSSGR